MWTTGSASPSRSGPASGFFAVVLLAASLPASAIAAEPGDCFDWVVSGYVVRQRFADVPRPPPEEDVFDLSSPGVIELQLVDALTGRRTGKRVRVHSLVHQYLRKDRLFTMRLRRNTRGDYNEIYPADGTPLRRCGPGDPPVAPHVPPGAAWIR